METIPELRRRRSMPWSFIPSSIPELFHMKKTEKLEIESKESSAEPEISPPHPSLRKSAGQNPLRMHPVDISLRSSSIAEDIEIPKKENTRKKKKTVRFDLGVKDPPMPTILEEPDSPTLEVVVTDDPNRLSNDPEDRRSPDHNMLHPNNAYMTNRTSTSEIPEHQGLASQSSGSAQLSYYHLNNSVSHLPIGSDAGPSSRRPKLSHTHPENHGRQETFPIQNPNQNRSQRHCQPNRQMPYGYRPSSSSSRPAGYVPWSYNQEFHPPSPFLRSVGRTSYYSHPHSHPQPSRYGHQNLVSRGPSHNDHRYIPCRPAYQGYNPIGHGSYAHVGNSHSHQSGTVSAESSGGERRPGMHPSTSISIHPTQSSPSLVPSSGPSVDLLARRENKKLPARYRRGKAKESAETEG